MYGVSNSLQIETGKYISNQILTTQQNCEEGTTPDHTLKLDNKFEAELTNPGNGNYAALRSAISTSKPRFGAKHM